MPATGSCRRLRRRGLSTVGSQALGCSRMCWCRSMQIINRSTVSLRSMLVKASTSTARRLQDGSAQPAICSRRWSMRFAITSYRRPSSMPTTGVPTDSSLSVGWRHAGAGARSRQRENQDGKTLDLCPRRPSIGRHNRACRLVRLLARPQGREPAPAPEALQGCAPGRRLRRLPTSL